LIIPVLGAILLIPAFLAGAGIPIVSFATALSWPLSLAGPVVGAWYVIGIGLAIYLFMKRRASLHSLAESTVDPEPATPATAGSAGAPLTAAGGPVHA
jgi:hypothetical protein